MSEPRFETQPELSSEFKEKLELIIREPRMEDCDDLVEVYNSIDTEEPRPPVAIKSTTREEFLPRLERIIDGINDGKQVCFVVEKDGHVVGLIGGGLSEEAVDIPTVSAGFIGVKKEARSLKLFRQLSSTWLERIKEEWGAKKVITETNVANPVLKLYKRMGFKEVGLAERKDYVKLEM